MIESGHVKTHDFHESCLIEEMWAPVLDDWFRAEGYEVRESTPDENKAGTDRWMRRRSPDWEGVDYKCDDKGQGTGNAFIETISNDVYGTPGWAVKDTGAWIAYFVIPSRVYIISTERLRAHLDEWRTEYRTAPAWNKKGHRGWGILVPLDVFGAVAEYASDV